MHKTGHTKLRTAMCVISSFAVISVLATTSPASAREGRGFLGDVGVATGIISPDQADALDNEHAPIGAPQLNPMQQGGLQLAPNTGPNTSRCLLHRSRCRWSWAGPDTPAIGRAEFTMTS